MCLERKPWRNKTPKLQGVDYRDLSLSCHVYVKCLNYFFTTNTYYFCNQENKKDYKNGSSYPHIPLMTQPTVICLSSYHRLKLFWQRLPVIPAKTNSISLVLILTYEIPHLVSKLPLSKLQRALSDCSFLVSVVGRIMAPRRCPHPNFQNLLPSMAKETLQM